MTPRRRRGAAPGRALLVAALAIVLVSGCASGAAGDAGAARREITVAVASEPVCWDPHVDPASATMSIQRNVFDSLVARRPDGSVGPWLAASWQVSPDQRSFTFVLRPDVAFHDGTPLTAEAVKANLDHIADPSTRSQRASAQLGPYADTDLVDARTAVVRFARPHASFLALASTTAFGLYSPRAIAERSDELCAGGPLSVGSGPFRLTDVVRGQRAELARNDAYRWWPAGTPDPGPARFATATIRFAAENRVRIGLLQSGQVDAVDTVSPVGAATLAADPRVRMVTRPKAGAVYALHLNTTRPPFDQWAAREAVRRAVDVDATVGAVFLGTREPARSPLSPSVPFARPTPRAAHGPDPAEADRLLDGLGYVGRDAEGHRTRGGTPLTVRWPSIRSDSIGRDDAVTVAVQQYLRRVGIRVLVEPADLGSYVARRNAGDYDLVAFSWNVPDASVLGDVFGSGSQFVDGGVNGSRVRDADVDRALALGESVSDPAERAGAYASVQRLVEDRAYTLPLYPESDSVAMDTSVRGLGRDAEGAMPLRTASRTEGPA